MIEIPMLARRAATQQHLVDVVVEDRAATLQIGPAEILRQGLGQRIADRIRMARALALDHFHRLLAESQTGYDQVHSL